MSLVAARFLRQDLNLSARWWHRLLKVVFVTLTIALTGLSARLFYRQEERAATHYVVLKNLQDYNREMKAIDLSVGASGGTASVDDILVPVITPEGKREWLPQVNVEGAKPQGFRVDFSDPGPSATLESFIADERLGRLLGCTQPNGMVLRIAEPLARAEANCDFGTTRDCYVADSLCGGSALRLVKYNMYVRYTSSDYARIAGGMLVVTIVWLLAILTIYYRGLMYIIYGRTAGDGALRNA